MNRIIRHLSLALLATSFALAAPEPSQESAKPAPHPNPVLYFSKADIPLLQKKIEDPAFAAKWKTILVDARQYCDPGSPNYADPASYLKIGDKPSAAHFYPRQLAGWMETLGFAYVITGDANFARHGAALLTAAAEHLTPEAPAMQHQFEGAYGDMMRAMAIGLDFLSPEITPQQRAKITDTARRYLVRHIQEFATNRPEKSRPHNFSGVCGGAIGMLAIALREDFPDEAPGWIAAGETMCTQWFEAGFDRDGSYFEGVGYMSYGLGNSLTMADALLRLRGRSALLENPLICKVSAYMVMLKLPGEKAMEARNDSLYYPTDFPFLPLLVSGFGRAGKEDALAAWLVRNLDTRKSSNFSDIIRQTGAPGLEPSKVLPAPYGAYYRDQGLCIWRTGWNTDDVMFSIEAGPYHPVTHNQADKGHFNLYGYGYRWAADPGYGNNREPKGRCQTEAHSCVLVDGKGQALSGAALGTDGKVLKETNAARYGYALIDSLSAYQHNNAGEPGIPLTKALRHAFFFRPSGTVPAYAVVLDDIEWGGETHDFLWQMITWNDMKVEEENGTTFIVTPPAKAPNTPKMKVILNAAAALALSDDVYTPDNYPGRAPNVYRRLHASAKTANPHFVAVLAPLPAGAPEPQLSVKTTEKGRLIQIAWGNHTDTILWSGATATLRE